MNNTKSQLDERLRIKSSFPFKVLIIEMIFILFKFFGFILCFGVFNSLNNVDYIFIFTIFCLSWSLGLIIPAAPGGIGVFEGSFLFLIGNNFSQVTIISSLIIFRLISSSADLIFSTPFFIKKVFKVN